MSNTFRMERTQAMQNAVTLTPKEAEEYCVYKRQKKIAEIMSAMRRLESVPSEGEDLRALCEKTARLRQPALRMTPIELLRHGEFCKRAGVKVDCVVGGNGETFSKVKAYEIKRALRAGAQELTAILTPSLIAGSQYNELRREIKRLRRAAGKATLKIRLEQTYPHATLSRLARLASECGAEYFSLPYFAGCEVLQTDLFAGCRLEVSGVETLADFKKMTGVCMGRALTNRAWALYEEWMKEVEKINVGQENFPKLPAEEGEKKPLTSAAKPLLLPVANS